MTQLAPRLGGPRAAGLTRVGCVGAGWIGRQRLEELVARCGVDLVGVVDPDPEACAEVRRLSPRAVVCADLDALLARAPDGVVIATPSALHAEQAIATLRAGAAVFCEKPLARSAAEARSVIETARREDLLVGVDLSYRHTAAARAMTAILARGEIGEVHAVELVFHNAYGPDKPWFTRRTLSGGGCLIDLGTHLLDLGLALAGASTATVEAARLTRRGHPVAAGGEEVEDFALAQLRADTGATLRVACSWFLPAGRECVFEATAFGTAGAVSMRNLDGSFYDFVAEHHEGTSSRRIAEPEHDWGGGAIAAWGDRLGEDERFDPEVTRLIALSQVLDDIYAVAT